MYLISLFALQFDDQTKIWTLLFFIQILMDQKVESTRSRETKCEDGEDSALKIEDQLLLLSSHTSTLNANNEYRPLKVGILNVRHSACDIIRVEGKVIERWQQKYKLDKRRCALPIQITYNLYTHTHTHNTWTKFKFQIMYTWKVNCPFNFIIVIIPFFPVFKWAHAPCHHHHSLSMPVVRVVRRHWPILFLFVHTHY